MRVLKFKINKQSLEPIYTAFVQPIMEYGDVLFNNCNLYDKIKQDRLQNEALRIIVGAPAHSRRSQHCFKYALSDY